MSSIQRIEERESPPWIVPIRAEDGFRLNPTLTQDFRLRGVVYQMLQRAAESLPAEIELVVYEGYRSRARQWELWRWIESEMRQRHPEAADDEIYTRTREFVADPRGAGSGHQAGAAIDVSLARRGGEELDMGTKVDEMSDLTRTHSPGLTKEQRAHRDLLLSAMGAAGFVNYPSEWWHYSWGDRLWAELTGAEVAFFGPLPD